MDKVIDAGSWHGPGMDVPATLIKVSSRGLRGNDLSDFLKTASHIFADQLQDYRPAADELPIHLNAIGATEGYGHNRNGDGFTEKTCQAHHHTFVKHAHFYENHKNKDPAKSFGIVKASAYNPRMRRIELLILGNMNKAAAARHGGLVLDENTQAKFERGDLVPFSMACKVAFDVCSNCMNKAASRAFYCDEQSCINPRTGRQGFGCKTGLTKVASDGFQQYVDNPDPLFFDISKVHRPADRIAFGTAADYFQKAAAAGVVPGGAALAEYWAQQGADFSLLGPEDTLFNRQISFRAKLAHELADLERQLEQEKTSQDLAVLRGLDDRLASPINTDELGRPGTTKAAQMFAAMTQCSQPFCLGLRDFLKWAGADVTPAAVSAHLPGVYGRLAAEPDLGTLLKTSKFQQQGFPPPHMRVWAQPLAADHSLVKHAVQDRLYRSVLRKLDPPQYLTGSESLKTAAASDLNEQWARQYAVYKLAFLATVPITADYPDLKLMAIRQNYVRPND
jgi:hypothetical protein